MIKDRRTNEVVEEYELEDASWCFDEYSKLLGKESTFNYKGTKDNNVYLDPYSELFKYNFRSNSRSFNNKKFSII